MLMVARLVAGLIFFPCMVNPPVRRGIMTDVWLRYRIGKLRLLSGHCRTHREAPGTMHQKLGSITQPLSGGVFYCPQVEQR